MILRPISPPPEGGFALRFEVDAPVSVNSLYIPMGRGKLILSPEGQEFKAAAGWAARAAMMAAGLEETTKPVAWQFEWSRPAHRRGDVSNIVKALEDAMKGIVWGDDEQVVEGHLYRDEVPATHDSTVRVSVWEVGRA